MAGRNPIPIAQHQAQGTYRPDRHKGKLSAQALTELPGAPAWLSRHGRAAWQDLGTLLIGRSVLTQLDLAALACVCEAIAEWRELRRKVRKDGRTYTTTTQAGDTMIRPHPHVNMLAAAERRMWAELAHFGLTPASRAKVSAGTTEATDNPWAKL